MALTINNTAYSWSMIQLSIPGIAENGSLILSGVTGIKWNRKWNIETNYGLGGLPASRGYGNWEFTASITMDYNTQVNLRSVYGSLIGLGEFNLNISFANVMGTDDYTSHTIDLIGCVFSEDGMEASQGDTNLTKEFDLNPFNIKLDGLDVSDVLAGKTKQDGA